MKRGLRSGDLSLMRWAGTSVWDLERNDIDGAIRVFDAAVREGAGELELKDLVRVLVRLPDSRVTTEELLGYLDERWAATP